MPLDRLVEGVRNGDRHAQTDLIDRYWRTAVLLAATQVGPNDAEDIAQDAFITALTQIHKLRENTKFLPWLKAIVINSARMALRRTQRCGR